MLPVIGDGIRQAEQQGEGEGEGGGHAPLDPSIAKALRRRQRGISNKKDLAEAGTIFKVPCRLYSTSQRMHQITHMCNLAYSE